MNLHGYIVLIDCSGIDLTYAIRNFYLFISDDVYVTDGVANGFSFKLRLIRICLGHSQRRE